MGKSKKGNVSLKWRGDEIKETKLKYNYIKPIFYSRLNLETEIKCCCGDPLTLNSRIYVFKVTSKDTSKSFYVHTEEGCGKRLIELSSRINNTDFRNIYFIETLNIDKEEAVLRNYGLRNYERQNDTILYTKFNKTYLVAIFILCQSWNQPFPYGKLAEAIDAIHETPEENCYLNIDFFNESIKKDIKHRKLIEMLEDYRKRLPNAFPNLNLDLLDEYIRNVIGTESRIK